MSNIIKFQSHIFILNFVRVLTHEITQTNQTGYLFCHLGHALEARLGVLGCQELNSVLSVMLSPPKP